MSSPRIISGSAKGLHLKSVPGDSTRPITDRVKEALFNIIGADIIGANFLDLFGGTGSVGIEALSRGAASAVFIEKSRLAYQTLQQNLDFCKVSQKSQLICGDAFSYLQNSAQKSFEYIFIAPPQYKGLWEKALLVIDQQTGILSEDGWVIIQIHPVEKKEIQLIHLECFDSRSYGSTLLLFYRKMLNDAGNR
ncbi:MAG: 16S rRNA (guanine(966)-N(2))-methyltransferase RsmD [Anaerolineaceae bacterium]|jgi:16S rRNA (guanine(966)-N(2))-methyltransferase RsmD|nr:MAG: 16S rRNA (guanine(966)-N(2))-methyltransferase RsmD [Anaerolineaceae bacterium]